MSAGAGSPQPSPDATNEDGHGPSLPEEVRRHLGRLLASSYESTHTEPSTNERFTDLLSRLGATLEEADRRDTEVFQAQLLVAAPALRRFALSLSHDPVAADDLVQETLLRAWRGRRSFQSGTNFEAWTFTILRNHFYTDRRKHREVEDEDGSYAERLISAPDQAARLDLQDVQAALDRLAAPMREALMLVAVSDLSYEEAAAVMGCQLGTVKSRVSRARDQLARALGYTGAEIGSDAVLLSALGGPRELGA